MPQIEYHVPVHAELQTIWRVLLDRIENPERYIGGVTQCDFPESTETYAVRELTMQGEVLKERITIDERQGEICYELLNHPLFRGLVYNALIPPAADDPKAVPVLQFRMDWEPKGTEAVALEQQHGQDLEDSIKEAVHFVRDVAEAIEKAPAAQGNA